MSHLKIASLFTVMGAAVGTALGLLYAPQPGAVTRTQLRWYSERAQDRAARLGRDVRRRVDRAVRYGRKLVA